MGHHVRTRTFEAAPDTVFRAYTDPAWMADWMDLQAVRDATGPLDVPGTSYTLVVSGRWQFRTRVLAADPPRTIAYEGRGPLGAWVRISAQLTPASGGTTLVQTTAYGLPLGPIGRVIDWLLVGKGATATADRELDRLAELIGGRTSAPH